MLQAPENINEVFTLEGALLNCWRPLLEILNNKRPQYMNIVDEDKDWFDAYMKGSDEEINERLRLLFEEVV